MEANVGPVRRQNEEWFSPLPGIGEVPIGRRRLILESESPFPSKDEVTCAFPGVFNDSGHRGPGLAVSGQSGDFTPRLDTAALPAHMGDGPRRCLALENLTLPGPAVGVVLDLDVYSRQLAISLSRRRPQLQINRHCHCEISGRFSDTLAVP